MSSQDSIFKFIICGTDTDIGKTLISSFFVKGLNSFYWKPIQSGIESQTDSQTVEKLAQLSKDKIIKEAYKAADELSAEGIEAEVIDLRTVRPIDFEAILSSVRKTNRLVILEEAWPLASISSEIAFRVQKDAFDELDAPVKRVTALDTPMAYAPTLVEAYLPNKDKVIKAVKEVMYI